MPKSIKNGFTLVELLVVMVIMATAMGLVGGLAVNGYTKYKAKSELMTLQRLVHQANIRAFTLEQAITLELQNNTAILRSERVELFNKTFEYLELPSENVIFNSKGIPGQLSIDIIVSGKTREMSLVMGT